MRLQHRGFTLVELAIACGIIGLGILMFVPLLSQSIDEVRQLSCAKQMALLGTGMLSYENSNGHLPRGRGYPDVINPSGDPVDSYSGYDFPVPPYNTDFLSAFTRILAFVDREDVAALIVEPSPKRMSAGGEPTNPNFAAATLAGKFFVCPADSNTTLGGVAESNYRVNFGGSTPYGGATNRTNQTDIFAKYIDPKTGLVYTPRGNGAFTIGDGLATNKFADGLAKTAMLSERTKGSGNDWTEATFSDFASRPSGIWWFPMDIEAFKNACSNVETNAFTFTSPGRFLGDWANGWLFAGYDSTQYNHVAPPNWQNIDCGGFSSISDTPGEHAISSARSMHPEGVNVVFADGHLQFVGNNIDLTVWRSLGARDDRKQMRQQVGVLSY